MKNFVVGFLYCFLFVVNFVFVSYGAISLMDGDASRLQWSYIETRRGAEVVSIFWSLLISHLVAILIFFKFPVRNRVMTSVFLSTFSAVPVYSLFGIFNGTESELLSQIVGFIFSLFFFVALAIPLFILPIGLNFLFFRFLDRKQK